MKSVLLAMAVLGVAGLVGCEADASAPNHSARNGHNLLAPGEKENLNAEKRETEKPQRSSPTGEFPGQTAAPAQMPTVVLADAGGVQAQKQCPMASWWTSFKSSFHATPPMHRTEAVPGTGMSVDANWGSLDALPDYAHRAWPDTQVNYESGAIKNNPVYFEDLTTLASGAPNNNYDKGTVSTNPLIDAVDIPWFFLNLAALPVLMVKDAPLAQRSTSVHWQQPAFTGYLPAGGVIAPTPVPGTVHWEYPKPTLYQTTQPKDTAIQPTTQPVIEPAPSK